MQRVRRLPGRVAGLSGIRSDRRRQPANCSCRTWSRSDELIAPRAGEGGQPPPWTLTYLWIPGSGEVRSGIPGFPWLPWCSAALAVGACPATVHLLEAAGRPPSRHVCVGAVHTCRCCRSRRVSGRWAVSVVRASRGSGRPYAACRCRALSSTTTARAAAAAAVARAVANAASAAGPSASADQLPYCAISAVAAAAAAVPIVAVVPIPRPATMAVGRLTARFLCASPLVNWEGCSSSF